MRTSDTHTHYVFVVVLEGHTGYRCDHCYHGVFSIVCCFLLLCSIVLFFKVTLYHVLFCFVFFVGPNVYISLGAYLPSSLTR